jgi:putative transposase
MEVTPVTEKTNPLNLSNLSTPETSPAVDAQLVAELVKRAQDGGLAVSGEGGLLQQLTKIVLESSLEGEMDAHLGYSKHDPQGRNGENSRNGKRAKTVLTEVGPVGIEVPRDPDSSFEPQILGKRQRRLDGIDAMVVSLSAKGLPTGEISAHLAQAYGGAGVQGHHQRDHRPGAGGHGPVAQPAARPDLPGHLHRCDPGEDRRWAGR